MSVPTIRSRGAPPEEHADRVVAEMLRMIVAARAARAGQIQSLVGEMPDGNPRAQAKLARRLEAVGRPFVLDVDLNPGKRGRYDLLVRCIEGWDGVRGELISEDDKIPGRPWLACTIVKMTSRGRGFYKEDAVPLVLITHHALSRLAQRCGARTSEDLLDATSNIFFRYLEEGFERRDLDWVKADCRLKFQLREGLQAIAVLKPHDGIRAALVATIIDTI